MTWRRHLCLALMPAASALLPTLGFDAAWQQGTSVETSLDTAGRSACATNILANRRGMGDKIMGDVVSTVRQSAAMNQNQLWEKRTAGRKSWSSKTIRAMPGCSMRS